MVIFSHGLIVQELQWTFDSGEIQASCGVTREITWTYMQMSAHQYRSRGKHTTNRFSLRSTVFFADIWDNTRKTYDEVKLYYAPFQDVAHAIER